MFLLFVALFASNGGDRWSSTLTCSISPKWGPARNWRAAAAAPDPYNPKGRHARSTPGAPLFVSGQTRSDMRCAVLALVLIDAVALDWKWLFIYPDQGVAAVNQLGIPAGTPVQFRLTSATVMNSFFVPQLGSQIYTMGGMTTHLSLLADKPGEYPGFSANFSGDGFSEMRFVVKSVPAGDFNAWIEQVRGTGSALDEAGYAELAKPSKAVPPITYRSVEPKLFERIIDQTVAGPRKAGIGGALSYPPRRRRGGMSRGRELWR